MARAKEPTGRASSQGKRSASEKKATRARASRAAAKRVDGKTAAPVLKPVPLYEFTIGGLAGQVRLNDPGRGIVFSSGAEGKSLPAVFQEVFSLRHYFSLGEGGLLAPREEAACEGKVAGSAVMFSYGKLPKWPVTATARYELLPQGGVDAILGFTFSRRLKGFEAGFETLMLKSQPAIYIHSGGAWTRASAGPQVQRFYPRNLGAAELMADGRWDALHLAGLALQVETHGYDYPMVVVRDEKTGWALAYMALTEQCTAVWLNGAQRSLGFNLIGADVRAEERITCRMRVVLCQAENLGHALMHYREFVQQARLQRAGPRAKVAEARPARRRRAHQQIPAG